MGTGFFRGGRAVSGRGVIGFDLGVGFGWGTDAEISFFIIFSAGGDGVSGDFMESGGPL
jgi:hypothetical protein